MPSLCTRMLSVVQHSGVLRVGLASPGLPDHTRAPHSRRQSAESAKTPTPANAGRQLGHDSRGVSIFGCLRTRADIAKHAGEGGQILGLRVAAEARLRAD